MEPLSYIPKLLRKLFKQEEEQLSGSDILGQLEQRYQNNKLASSVAVAGLIIFILVASTLPFKDQLLSSLFPKKSSLAAASPGDWPQLQYDASHGGYIPDTYSAPFTTLWKRDDKS